MTNIDTGSVKKRGHRLMTIILSNLNRFTKFFTARFHGKFVVKWILKIPTHLLYVATLLCESLMSAKQAINDILQGSVAAYLGCGGVVNNQIKKGLLLSLTVKKIKSVNIWQSYKQEHGFDRSLSSSFSSALAMGTKCTGQPQCSSNRKQIARQRYSSKSTAT